MPAFLVFNSDSETNTLFVEDEDDIELEDERDADEFAATSLERALASRTLVDDNDIEDLHDFESATLKKKTKRVTDPSASPSTPHHPATSRKRKTQSHRRTFLSGNIFSFHVLTKKCLFFVN